MTRKGAEQGLSRDLQLHENVSEPQGLARSKSGIDEAHSDATQGWPSADSMTALGRDSVATCQPSVLKQARQ